MAPNPPAVTLGKGDHEAVPHRRFRPLGGFGAANAVVRRDRERSRPLRRRGSADPDGKIAAFSWVFGGASASGPTAQHVYGHVGSYTVTLTVTDNAGGTAAVSKTVVPISLTARAYKTLGIRKVDLSWNGPSGSFDVYRNGVRVATVQATTYTDTVATRGTYTYKVCAHAAAMCSNNATIVF